MGTSQRSKISEDEIPNPIQLIVSDDKLTIAVSVDGSIDDLNAIVETIQMESKRLNTSPPLSVEYIKNWFQKNSTDTGYVQNSILLEGRAPELPVDGSIEWADDFFSSGFKVDPKTGSVDYRQRTGRSSVAKNELLATIVAGVPGKNGKDVFGEPIQVEKPVPAKMTVGKNVELRKEIQFFATESGRVELVGDRLSVSDIFVISGSVGLESGNIDHPGSLQIQQDVSEDSVVEVTGNIDIQGMIERATVTADGNLHVRGGICGKEGTRIKVTGEIHAKFILECEVECGGDVIVESEIVHSTIKSQGAVRIPQGRVVGGRIIALGGIDVGEAGSDACVETEMVPGVDYELQAIVEDKLAQLKTIQAEEEEIAAKLKPVLPYIKSLAPQQKSEVIELLGKAKELSTASNALQETIQEHRELSSEDANPTVIIQKSLFPELKVHINGERNKFKQSLGGPLVVECVAEKIRVKSLE